jgi:hypothetical protein
LSKWKVSNKQRGIKSLLNIVSEYAVNHAHLQMQTLI